MTREDALDSGIRQAWRFVGDVADDVTPEEAEALCDGSGASLDYGGPFDCAGCQACEP